MEMKIKVSCTFAYLTLFITLVMLNRWSLLSETDCHLARHKNARNGDRCLCYLHWYSRSQQADNSHPYCLQKA